MKMQYFIDFEATQFTQEIISIGCVCETGESFYSLVKTAGKKNRMTNFITKLTGITKEMLESAPDSDTVFIRLDTFMKSTARGETPIVYCYGEGDKALLDSTIKRLTTKQGSRAARTFYSWMVDFSPKIKKSLQLENEPSLKKVYTFISKEEIVQKHNALEDAEMLRQIALNLKSSYTEEERAQFNELKVHKDMPYAKLVEKKAPDIWYTWTDILKKDKYTANTNADYTNYKYRCKIGQRNKYFDNEETAALWAIRFLSVPNRSPKEPSHIKKTIKEINSVVNTDNRMYDVKWYRKD